MSQQTTNSSVLQNRLVALALGALLGAGGVGGYSIAGSPSPQGPPMAQDVRDIRILLERMSTTLEHLSSRL